MRPGFTLLEMMVALTVLGLTATLALPAFRGPGELDPLETAVGDVRALLESVRRAAIREGRVIELTLDPATARYWLRSGTEPRDGPHRLDLPDGVRFEALDARARMVFMPDGTTLQHSLAVVDGGRARHMALDPWSGRVHVSR